MPTDPPLSADLHLREAIWPDDHAVARTLLGEYLASLSDLACHRALAEELADLPGPFGQVGGGMWLARVNGDWAGCCGYRALPEADHPNACEMKRLYVRPAYRRLGVGHALAQAVQESAQVAGYSCLLLDTLNEMEAARALYEDMGFVPVPPYTRSPVPGAHHLKLVW